MLERVPQDAVTRAWLRCLPVLQPAIRRSVGQLDAATVLFGLVEGSMQLWMDTSRGHLLAAVTSFSDNPGIRVLVIALLGGRGIGDWLHEVEETFLAHARASGCQALECYVRPGMVGARYDKRRAAMKRWTPHWTMVRLAV